MAEVPQRRLWPGPGGERTFYVWGEFSHIGLGIGFILIYLIALLYQRCSHWWPLILVIIGVLFLLGAIGKKRKPKTGS